MTDRCSTRCDHDSQCTLLAGHGDRHETDHGCICYDPRQATRAEIIDAWKAANGYDDEKGVENMRKEHKNYAHHVGAGLLARVDVRLVPGADGRISEQLGTPESLREIERLEARGLS